MKWVGCRGNLDGMRVLVATASRHGSTHKIADAIGDMLQRAGLDVDICGYDDAADVAEYDAFVLGSATYYEHWLEPARKFILDHRATLAHHPVWLFSAGWLSADHPEASADEHVAELLSAAGTDRHRTFGGRLDLGALSSRERAIARSIDLPEADTRDWEDIGEYGREIAAELVSSVVSPST